MLDLVASLCRNRDCQFSGILELFLLYWQWWLKAAATVYENANWPANTCQQPAIPRPSSKRIKGGGIHSIQGKGTAAPAHEDQLNRRVLILLSNVIL